MIEKQVEKSLHHHQVKKKGFEVYACGNEMSWSANGGHHGGARSKAMTKKRKAKQKRKKARVWRKPGS